SGNLTVEQLLNRLRPAPDFNVIDPIKQQTQTASTIPSPIILDLDGDGVIGTVGLGAGVFFDHAADGFAERTGWVAPRDGLLVWDRNANGTIDTGRELFGSETLLPNGLKAVNGFEALAALDANGDGIIDANDPVYAQLRVWVDANLDGRTGEGELLTLEEAGVRSIRVAYTNSTHVDAQGNAHRQVGSYTTTEGHTRLATDVWFQVKRSAANDAQWIQAA
ncbi:MAG: calcium-binding protein, partial [Gammaproteobacteria bacterium]